MVGLTRKSSVIITVTSLFLLSLAPWKAKALRTVGPLAVFVVFGIPAFLESLSMAATLDIHFLMTAAAFASAVIGHAHEGAMLLLLFVLSEVVEERLSMKATASIDALGRLTPEKARRLPPGAGSLAAVEEAVEVPTKELRLGDRVIVRAGEVVPVDGQVVDGASQVGLDHLTGEPLPVSVKPGDPVISGARNIDGALLLEVQREASESTIQQIGRLTQSAAASRPGIVTLLDAVAARWSVAVIVSTVLVGVVPPLLLGAPLGASFYRSLVWLITASPCALILATPLVYVSGLSLAASKGVLLKGGRTLDALAATSGVAFDKTGTLTTGTPEVVGVDEVLLGAGGEGEAASEQRARRIGAALGRLSVHPVSKALALTSSDGGAAAEIKDFKMVAGEGVLGLVSEPGEAPVRVALGRPRFVEEQLASAGSASEAMVAALRSRHDDDAKDSAGYVLCALASLPDEGSETPGRAWIFRLKDHVKASAAEVLVDAAERGPVYMMTGDTQRNADRVAQELKSEVAFASVSANMRPEEKLAKVKELDGALRATAAARKGLGARILRRLGVTEGGLTMVGDGVNDAPALAAATAGISLASQADGALPANAVGGTDVLVLRRASDLAGDADLRRVRWVMNLSRQARRIVKQNIGLALCSICGASAATLCVSLPLWLGVLLHEGTTMLVALNSLRLFSKFRSKSA